MIGAIELRNLGDVCQFVRGPFGGSLKKDCFVADGYAVYEQQHAIYDQFEDVRYFIDEKKFLEMKRFELSEGDLIMSCSGTMGKVAIVPNGIRRGIINQALLKLTPNALVDKWYLKYWMSSAQFKQSIAKHSKGAAIKNVASVAVLKNIEIPLPPLPEQYRIVSILDEAFAAIDKAKANIEKNIANAKELFQSELNAIFSQKSEGWVEKRIMDVCELRPSKQEARDKLNLEDQVTFLPMEDLSVNALYVQPKQEKALSGVFGSYTYFADGDVLLAKITPCFENGKIGIANDLKNGVGFGSSEYLVFRPK